jgi:hypothetical protein
MVVVSITRLRVRHWRYLPGFFFQTVRSALQAKSASGNLAVSIVSEARNTFWTRSVWESEAALRGFMLAGAHKRAMPKLARWCDEGSIVRWTQETLRLPDWNETHQRMQKEGRASKVAHPSPDHASYTIPAPQVRPGQELVFK